VATGLGIDVADRIHGWLGELWHARKGELWHARKLFDGRLLVGQTIEEGCKEDGIAG
jgi:hypothetical protein